MKKPVWTQAKKDEIKRIFVDWLGRLYVTPLNITYQWREEASDGDDKDSTCYFEVHCGFPYRSITLTCYPEAATLEKEAWRMYLLHEAMHCVLAPIDKSRYEPFQTYRQFMEFVTDNLTHYVWSLVRCLWDRDDEIERLKKEIGRLKHRKR